MRTSIPFLLRFLLVLVSIPLLVIPGITVLLALVTHFRFKWLRKGGDWSQFHTAIYTGRVSHTRFQPVTHSFSYPVFFCCLDLSEVSMLFGTEGAFLWPLTLLMSFRDGDHLKNGEGNNTNETKGNANTFAERIARLVLKRTNGIFSLTTANHQILLVTHLAYFGYCFNPVSFYYILEKSSNRMEAVVAEVSNTPWNEMKCYVLHPDSVDVTMAQPGRTKNLDALHLPPSKDEAEECHKEPINYIFPKTFHVSPFMDMDYVYDWTFWHPTKKIVVSTSMIRTNNGTKCFNAYLNITRQGLHPLSLAYQLLRLPIFCVIIQIWIHLEAFALFVKGVEFVPHPEGSDTTASRLIGKLMSPFFTIKDWVAKKAGGDGLCHKGLQKHSKRD